MSRILRIGTRGSKMAMAQTQAVIDALKAVDPTLKVEAIPIKTTGDKFMGDLKQVGGKGAFTKEIEHSLLNNEVDMAMHSMKDVPGDVPLPEGLIIPAVLSRDDIRDVVVCREGESFVALKEGAKVGTSSVRRGAIIKNAFPYLKVVPIRGSADNRLRKLDDGEVDALILAKSGLERIGMAHRISEVFEPDMMCPAVSQGCIGVECRADDTEVIALLKKINDKDTFACITAERAMLEKLKGSCHTPIAGFCQVTKGGNLRMIAMVASLDGKTILRGRQKFEYENAVELGQAVADELLEQGAAEILEACK